jgi:hypothetical protein
MSFEVKKCLGECEVQFETNLEYESGGLRSPLMEKTGGKKSHATHCPFLKLDYTSPQQ